MVAAFKAKRLSCENSTNIYIEKQYVTVEKIMGLLVKEASFLHIPFNLILSMKRATYAVLVS
ncbi:hypothetical protein BN1200_530002 [Klebsiella variicola]|nr:hypothetical protein BN1200_530002 [Klebsiella variicola]